jgi:hypothetical protein
MGHALSLQRDNTANDNRTADFARRACGIEAQL